MINLKMDCEMVILSEEQIISGFDCGNADLNEFFNRDALEYARQMLARTFFSVTTSAALWYVLFPFRQAALKLPICPAVVVKK